MNFNQSRNNEPNVNVLLSPKPTKVLKVNDPNFDEEGFRADVKHQGYSDKEVDAYLFNKGYYDEVEFKEQAQKDGYTALEIDAIIFIQSDVVGTPTDRALHAASTYYVDLARTGQNNFVTFFSKSAGTPTEAINNFALYLDHSPETLSLIEAQVQMYQADNTDRTQNYWNQLNQSQIDNMQIKINDLYRNQPPFQIK